MCLQGVWAVNPVNNENIPIFISDYVLVSYGTGAIMAVPGHDTRDWEFAKKFNLPIVEVVQGGDIETEAFTDCETGTMVNSGFLTGMSVEDGKKAITEWLIEQGKGVSKVTLSCATGCFHAALLGEPFPIVHCDHCGFVPLPESAFAADFADGREF